MPKNTPPTERVPGYPDGPDDVINLYGTYEIQPTADTDHRYPMIAQGLSRSERERSRRSRRLHQIAEQKEQTEQKKQGEP